MPVRQKSSPRRDPLKPYRAKRRFTATPEPAGAPPRKSKGPGGRFVVQRHRARQLHYDFRLEIGGVLASWAVPKGPSLDPKVRRQAIHVEDHPVEHFSFEGVIPKGEYGGDDVIVWDWGQWTPAEGVDPARAIADGELHFDLDGERLKGRFVLVRTGEQSGKEKWLLLHKNDEHAAAGWDAEAVPESVKSGRTNDQVARAPEARWRSDKPAAQAEESLRADIPTWAGPTDDEVAALDALREEGLWELQGRSLKLTNLDNLVNLSTSQGEDESGAGGRPAGQVRKAPALRRFDRPWSSGSAMPSLVQRGEVGKVLRAPAGSFVTAQIVQSDERHRQTVNDDLDATVEARLELDAIDRRQ